MDKRIHLVGNIANNFFREAVALRRAGFTNLHLYFAENPASHPSSLPVTEDSSLAHGYPDWIHPFPSELLEETRRYSKLEEKSRSFRVLVRELSEGELTLFSGGEIVLIPWVKSLNVFRVTGGDLTVLPFYTRCIRSWLARDGAGWNRQLIRVERAFRKQAPSYRRAVREASLVAMNPHPPYLATAKKLRIKPEKIVEAPQLSIDERIFDSVPPEKIDLSFLRGASPRKDTKVFFLGSRYMPTRDSVLTSIGDWKASERALIGFSEFLSKLEDRKSRKFELWIPASEMSFGVKHARELAIELNISSNVRFIAGSTDSGLTRMEMIQIMSHSCGTLDDFGVGWFGSLALEALACSSPLVTWVNPSFLRQFPHSPILTAQYPHEIAMRLMALSTLSPRAMQQLRVDSRKWVLRNFGVEATRNRYEKLLSYAGNSD